MRDNLIELNNLKFIYNQDLANFKWKDRRIYYDMLEKSIKIFRLTETAKLPTKAEGDMCYDVYSDEDVAVSFGDVSKIKTGLKIAPPSGYHYSVRDRSGLAVKEGIHIIAGQIDNSYRGELIICLTSVKSRIYNNDFYYIKKGDKIAQLKFEQDTTFPITEVQSEEDLGTTSRGSGGFGSTGK